MGRVLEFGTLRDVHWLIDVYGKERIHTFFRESGHPELSKRTIAFWRNYFNAEHETWRKPPAFRRSSSSFWVAPRYSVAKPLACSVAEGSVVRRHRHHGS